MRLSVVPLVLASCLASSCSSYSTFTAPDLSKLTLSVVPSNVAADGQSACRVSYVLRDSSGAPLPKLVVDIASSIGTVSPATAVTDANGQVTVSVVSPQNGMTQVVATVQHSDQVWQLPLKGSINFFTPVPGTSGAVASGTGLSADVTVGLGFTGTVHFTSTDPNATLPPDYTFMASDGGFKIFPQGIVLRTPGQQTVTAIDVATGAVVFQETFNVAVYSGGSGASPGTSGQPAVSLRVTGIATPIAAGQAADLLVTALDANGNTATGYLGTVHFTSSDQQATLPGSYLFTAADAGAHLFTDSVALGTPGAQSVTATDSATSTITGSQTDIQVGPGTTAAFFVTGLPTSTVAGVGHALTVQAIDVYGNLTPSYEASVTFISTDPKAVLPDTKALTRGAAAFNGVIFRTAGQRGVTAISSTDASVTGSQSNITVSAASAGSFALGLSPNIIAGQQVTMTVTTQDVYGNGVSDYNGTVQFASSDTQATLPGASSISGGAETLPNALIVRTAGNQWVSVTDTSSGLTGSINFPVAPGAPSNTASGMIINPNVLPSDGTDATTVTVLAMDAYGNAIPGQNVLLGVSGTGSTFGTVSGTTDASGSFTTSLKSTTKGAKTVTATIGPVSANGNVFFVEPATFAAPVPYAIAYGGSSDYPRYLTAADVNGDGHQDVIVVTSNTSTILVSLGNGDGTFGAGTTYTVSDNPSMIAAADLNHDNQPDLAFATDHNVTILFNSGTGTFPTMASTSIASTQGFGIALADLNGDGNQDIAVAGPATYIAVFMNNGDGTLQPMVTYPITNNGTGGFQRSAIAAADLTGNGNIDLAVAVGQPSGIYTFLNQGGGIFAPFVQNTANADGIDMALADVTGDGYIDALTTNNGTTVTVLPGNGTGTYSIEDTYTFGDWPCSYAIADFNADGTQDLAVASYWNAEIFLAMNMGGGNFPYQAPYSLGTSSGNTNSPWQVVTRDFNEDGKPDIAVSTSNAAFLILLNTTP